MFRRLIKHEVFKMAKPKYRVECEGETEGWSALNEETREVYLTGTICDEMASSIIPAIRDLDNTRGTINLIISSGGGDIDPSFAIYDTIFCAKNKTRAYCYGICASGAALILQSCDERYMSPNCRYMIHNGTVAVDCSLNEGVALAQEVKGLNSRMIEIATKRSIIPLDKVRKMFHNCTFLSADEAYEAGFIDGILVIPKRRRKW